MQTTTGIFDVTPAAAVKLKAMRDLEDEPDTMALRLEVQPGGCAGFRYGLFFDDEIAEDDVSWSVEGLSIVCDKMSTPYLKGVVIDWAETLQQSGFVINNPNAEGRCACGDSFH